MSYIVAPLLKVGKKNATLAEELCSMLNLDKRSLFNQIEIERRGEALIIGSTKGYYLPENVQEIAAYKARVYKRINTEKRNVRAFEKVLEAVTASETRQLHYDETGHIVEPTSPEIIPARNTFERFH